MRKGNPEPLSNDLAEEVRLLETAATSEVDTLAMPEVRDWSRATRGTFYRPTSATKAIPIDAEIVAYFESQGSGYLQRINRVLRASMLRGLRRPERPS